MWNDLYNEEKEKEVGYLVSYKWFEAWQMYISHHYNVNIRITSCTQPTIKSVRTVKRVVSESAKKSRQRLETAKDLHGCRAFRIPRNGSTVKDIDCVHSHLGERPREITNEQLEGEYEEVLREGIVENMDYVLVSERVWNYLKEVY